LADDLASAAHLIVGESNEQTLGVLIKNGPVLLSEKADPYAMVTTQEQCLFASRLQPRLVKDASRR